MEPSNNTALLLVKITLSYIQPQHNAVTKKFETVCSVCLTSLFMRTSSITGIVFWAGFGPLFLTWKGTVFYELTPCNAAKFAASFQSNRKRVVRR